MSYNLKCCSFYPNNFDASALTSVGIHVYLGRGTMTFSAARPQYLHHATCAILFFLKIFLPFSLDFACAIVYLCITTNNLNNAMSIKYEIHSIYWLDEDNGYSLNLRTYDEAE